MIKKYYLNSLLLLFVCLCISCGAPGNQNASNAPKNGNASGVCWLPIPANLYVLDGSLRQTRAPALRRWPTQVHPGKRMDVHSSNRSGYDLQRQTRNPARRPPGGVSPIVG